MVQTIVVARDMIRVLGERVDNCNSDVPLGIYRVLERVTDAYDEKEID